MHKKWANVILSALAIVVVAAVVDFCPVADVELKSHCPNSIAVSFFDFSSTVVDIPLFLCNVQKVLWQYQSICLCSPHIYVPDPWLSQRGYFVRR